MNQEVKKQWVQQQLTAIEKVAQWLQKNGHADVALKVTCNQLDILNQQ